MKLPEFHRPLLRRARIVVVSLAAILAAGCLFRFFLYPCSIAEMIFETLGQIFHMVMNYPIWVWMLFACVLLAGTRLWGLIGAMFAWLLIGWVVHRLDVSIIGRTGADTADIVFALGSLYR